MENKMPTREERGEAEELFHRVISSKSRKVKALMLAGSDFGQGEVKRYGNLLNVVKDGEDCTLLAEVEVEVNRKPVWGRTKISLKELREVLGKRRNLK